MFGSVPLRTYLPDGDIDVSIFCEAKGLQVGRTLEEGGPESDDRKRGAINCRQYWRARQKVQMQSSKWRTCP